MARRNLDTAAIGLKAVNIVNEIVLDSGHILQKIDGDTDIGIDGYIRIRKKAIFKKEIRGVRQTCEDYVDTGNLVGIQIKGVSEIPTSGSNSYFINVADRTKFGVNFSSKENLEKRRSVWSRFIGPVILVFVNISTKECWWTDLNDPQSYSNVSEYLVLVNRNQTFEISAFKKIRRLGGEQFVKGELKEIQTKNYCFPKLSLTNFKESALDLYKELEDGPFSSGENPTLGKVHYSRSGWKHITRLNRRKMRIFNSLTLLFVSKLICNQVPYFTRVKKGEVRESKRFIKKVDYLTLRAKVTFNFRESSIVQVVLRRVKTFDKVDPSRITPDAVFFHSVYEPYRKE